MWVKGVLVNRMIRSILLVLLIQILTSSTLQAESVITSPLKQFGFDIGDDYQLFNYAQLVEYWKKLERESARMVLVEIGKTAEGRSQLMSIITSPENQAALDRYKWISRELALAKNLNDDEAHVLATEGKAVVWIDGGLHATEAVGTQQLAVLVYEMVSRSDPETMRFLKDVILLVVHANPDGHDLVADWYMREEDPTKRSITGVPRLYQKYIGHDNNRDFYMSTQPETGNMNRVMYREWFPQIVYDHHQSSPDGAVLFTPPFYGPFNYLYDPIVMLEVDLVGAAMQNRLAVESKPGATRMRGGKYSTWWNGGLRTTAYFHNMVGILTEIKGGPTPIELPFLPEWQLPSPGIPYPISPQKWHFRRSIEYSMTSNRAVLDVASKYREDFLFNIYRMGKNSIERGSRDYWTIYPERVEAVKAALAEAKSKEKSKEEPRLGIRSRGEPLKFFNVLRDPDLRDPRGYILPSSQPTFLTATKFVNTLIKTGVVVHRGASDFVVGDQSYPAGSYVIKTAQAFRPHILSMFEPQNYPNNFARLTGQSIQPYDSVGWTLAYQMGIEFDRILEGFDGPLEELNGPQESPAGEITGVVNATGFTLSHQVNDSFIAVNRLLKSGEEVYWLKDSVDGGDTNHLPGTMYIPRKVSTLLILKSMAEEFGLNFSGLTTNPAGAALKLNPVRIGLWDRYGGSMASGWLRWILEQFEFPFEIVYPKVLDKGNLTSEFDVLILADDAVPYSDDDESDSHGLREGIPTNVPVEFRSRLGRVTLKKTVPHLRQFLEEGGTIVAIGRSTSLGVHLGLPIEEALMEKLPSGEYRPLPRSEFSVPGSLLQVNVDSTNPLGYGVRKQVDVFFDNSPVFTLHPEAVTKGIRAVAWFSDWPKLRSGWSLGEHYLGGSVCIIDASVGAGKLFLYGPEVTFRAQSHGTFKFLFNGIYYGTAEDVELETVLSSAG